MSETGETGAAAPPAVPKGFVLIERTKPGFMALCGPTYLKNPGDGSTPVLALRVEEKHLNMRGIVHGGLLVTLADSALATGLHYARKVPLSLVTVSLTTDFVEAAHLGDWIEAHVDVQRVGARMAFANCYLHVGEKRILRASGVFAVVKSLAPAPKERFDG